MGELIYSIRNDVPEPARATWESVEIYQTMVWELFEKYPVTNPDPERFDDLQIHDWRQEAMSKKENPEFVARNTLYYAADTGVPFDELFTPYALLFL